MKSDKPLQLTLDRTRASKPQPTERPFPGDGLNGQITLHGERAMLTLDLTWGMGWMAKELRIEPDITIDRNRERRPKIQAVWQHLPFRDDYFERILFDPPHLLREPSGWANTDLWRHFSWFSSPAEARKIIYQAFKEILRVLRPGGVCIFKWNDTEKPLNWIIAIAPRELEIQRSDKRNGHGVRVSGSHTTYYVWFRKWTEGDHHEVRFA